LFAGKLTAIRTQLEELLQKVDGALLECVAAIRKVFMGIREAIHKLGEKLGSYDADGKFHFGIEQQLEKFLRGVRARRQHTIEPLITQFKTTVTETLGQIQAALGSITGEIDGVRAQLQASLTEVHGKLQSVDVKGTMDAIRQKLDGMLSQLGAVDFDV